MLELMRLRVEKKNNGMRILLDDVEFRGVKEYAIKSDGPGFAELSIKLEVKYPVEQNYGEEGGCKNE